MSVPLLTFSSCCFISFILFLLSAAGWKRERSSAVRFPADGSNSGSKTPWRVKDADVNSLNNRNPKAKFQGNTRRTRIELDFFSTGCGRIKRDRNTTQLHSNRTADSVPFRDVACQPARHYAANRSKHRNDLHDRRDMQPIRRRRNSWLPLRPRGVTHGIEPIPS